MIIVISDHISNYSDHNDGLTIFEMIRPLMEQGEKVVISFQGVDAVSPTFVNSAFIELLSHFDFEFIKEHLSFDNSYKHINDLIKKRFAFEARGSFRTK